MKRKIIKFFDAQYSMLNRFLRFHSQQLIKRQQVEAEAESPLGENQLKSNFVSQSPRRQHVSYIHSLVFDIKELEELITSVQSAQLRLQRLGEMQECIAEMKIRTS
jgi:hypothetical protein